MDISSVNRFSQGPPMAAPIAPVDRTAETRDIVRAVKALNKSEMFGQDNELMFQRDRQTQRMVLQIVNRDTNEVISQIPPEYVLRLAQDLKPRA
jgi:uncharacterized FlaG/YvyC family protein